MPLLLVGKLKSDGCTRLSVDQWCGLRFHFAAAYEIKFWRGHAGLKLGPPRILCDPPSPVASAILRSTPRHKCSSKQIGRKSEVRPRRCSTFHHQASSQLGASGLTCVS
jgi:hypothetical protein